MKTSMSDQPSNRTDFRCTRKTNDERGWMAMGLLTCVTFPLCYLVYLEGSGSDFLLVGLFFVAAILAIVCQLRELIFPREWELVVNDVEIRWSRMNRSHGQETLSLENVKYLVVGRAERTVAENTGGFFNRTIGQYIFTKASFAAFLKFMADRHPEIRIVVGDGHLAAETETSH